MFSYLHQPKGFYKHLFLLALPVIVQNLITTSLGFLDTFMVGLLGSDQMSAVTVANVPVFIIQLVVFGLQSGSSVLISQYWGRGDRESINRVMGIGFMIAGGVSVLFAAILCAFPAQVLYLITGGKINPLIGAAGVSAVPMAARVAQVEGRKYNPTNFLLMHAMGPNVAGVVGSAVAAGILLSFLG